MASLQTRISFSYNSNTGTPEVDVVGNPVAGVSQLSYTTLSVTRDTTNKIITIDVAAYADPNVLSAGYQPNAEFTFATFNLIANAGANVTLSFDPVNSKVIRKGLTPEASVDVLSSTLPASVVVATVDSTPPAVTILTKPAAVSSNKNPSFTFSATDTGSGLAVNPYSYQLSGQNKVTGLSTGAASFTNLADGSYRFTAYAVDKSNNEGSAFYDFVVDTTAPVVTVTGPGLTNQTAVSFSWTVADRSGAVLTYQYRLDNAGNWITVSGTTYTWTGLTEGSHTFSVRVTDDAGNQGTANKTFTVDLTAPTVSITGPTFSGNSGSFTFSATDANGLAATNPYAYSLSGPTSVPKTVVANPASPILLTNLLDGSYVLTAYAKDAAGNEGMATKSFSIDVTGPTVTMTGGPADGAVISTNSATFSYSSEAGAVFQTKLDNGSWSAWSTATGNSWVTYSSLTVGSHVFSVHARDQAGNVGPDVVINFTVNLTAALSFQINLEGFNSQFHPNKTVRVRLYTGSNFTSYTVPVTADATGQIWSGTLTGVTPGTYDVYIKGPTHLQKNFGSKTFTAGQTTTGNWVGTWLRTGDIAGSVAVTNPNGPDNMVDSSDLGIVVSEFSMSTPKTSIADLTGDGYVDSSDLGLVISNFKMGVYGDGGAE
jgi:hypothetical protein